MTIEALRTPEDRFENLPGYNFSPNYLEDLEGSEGLRVHYLDEGPSDADQTFLCLHGQPAWSYLYRKMIPVFSTAGHRSITPDLLGFGKSDKPTDESVYTFDFHRQMLVSLIERLDLKNITLVCQDWGGLLGLTLPVDMTDRFSRLIVMNTAFASGDIPLGQGFLDWRDFNNANPDMAVGRLFKRSNPEMSEGEWQAYDAPFPDASYKSGVRQFPNLVPDNPDAGGAALSRRARDWFGTEWSGKTFMAVGMQDPVLGPPAMSYLRTQIKGCPEPLEMKTAGHFVQEQGDIVAKKALDYFG